ncbi:cilia- and flagella-associated protein 57-like [Dreissena polymorpha]|uniref:cilia- and flagella-associated protein 57-like n=1 Tax=Dreissena polymorpha TaxID=45954 RepID=UPI0022652EB1|nr:cilia- and flagella-associated protein 57-like [Dreissena polymorpha]
MSAPREQRSDTTLTRQEICNVDNDMQSSGVKVFSDLRSAAKEIFLRMQDPNDMRSLEEKTAKFQLSLRQAEKMFEDQDIYVRRLLDRSCVLEAALNASEDKRIQMEPGLYEERMRECEMLKSRISTDHSRELLPKAKSLEDMRKICVKNEETFLKDWDLLQQSLEDMRNICVKNEETFVKEMDLLQKEIARREEDIKKLNLSLQSVKSCSKEDRNKWQRQIEAQDEHIIILKKKIKILQNRVNTLNETVKELRRKSAVTLGVRSEPSHQLEQLIEKDAQLKQEYDEIQKELDKLLSGHQVNMTDSPTTRGLSTLSTDKFENDEVTLRKHIENAEKKKTPVKDAVYESVDYESKKDDPPQIPPGRYKKANVSLNDKSDIPLSAFI